ncbi:MAG: hypothetical protein J6K96_06085 [Treponema sp.]|nr:hypothetical protein [Treponema sp.]
MKLKERTPFELLSILCNQGGDFFVDAGFKTFGKVRQVGVDVIFAVRVFGFCKKLVRKNAERVGKFRHRFRRPPFFPASLNCVKPFKVRNFFKFEEKVSVSSVSSTEAIVFVNSEY